MSLLSTTRRDYKAWQPFATSTPLKRPPQPLKAIILPPKLLKPSEAVNVILNGVINSPITQPPKTMKQQNCPKSEKKIRKNRSSFFFEENLSSSEGEDEEVDNNQGVNIKIESNNLPRAKSIMKKRSSEDNVENNNQIINIEAESKNVRKTKSVIKKRNSENSKSKVDEEEQKIERVNQRGNKQSKKLSQENCAALGKSKTKTKAEDEVELIIDYKSNKEVKDIENQKGNDVVNEQMKENINISSSTKESKALSNSVLHKKSALKEINNIRKSKIPQLQNRRGRIKRKVNASPVRQKKPKIVTKAKEEIKVVSPLHIRNKKNNSHQLFSDSVEQELINSLDLTKAEEKPVELPSKNKSKPKNLESIKRPLRQKKTPKPFWLPEIPKSEKPADIDAQSSSNLEVKLEPDKDIKVEVVDSAEEPQKIDTENISVGEKKKEDEVMKAEEVDHEFKAPLPKVKRTYRKRAIKVTEPTTARTRRQIENLRKEADNKEVCKEEQIDEKEEVKVAPNLESISTSHSEFFKPLHQLSFQKGNQPGHLTAECLSLKHFKCGVFKVGSNSQVSSCTAFPNSYFGGVLLKGNLKMKIGTEETILNEGDSAMVPPLTDWVASNVSDSEAAFYYWCGRFKT